eukprot:TRINITY_DN50775_c0_g1_i1.p1 TRINITY_DN50775_c0_g1~~TRINITY_DN50775_c0_g1_i1.p1  ORF type:complete len:431 (+),score=127.82 TRINITY_DN50775_c0_g1_i1:98-1294(+)
MAYGQHPYGGGGEPSYQEVLQQNHALRQENENLRRRLARYESAVPQAGPTLAPHGGQYGGGVLPGADAKSCTSIFVGNLPEGSTDEQLNQICVNQGLTVVSVTKRPENRYGFVDFDSPKTAQKAVLTLDGQTPFHGTDVPLGVRLNTQDNKDRLKRTGTQAGFGQVPAKRDWGGSGRDCLSIFLGPILPTSTDEEVRQLIEPHTAALGNIQRITKPPGKAFAFVDFDTREAASAAVTALDGADHAGKRLGCRPNLPEFKTSGGGAQPQPGYGGYMQQQPALLYHGGGGYASPSPTPGDGRRITSTDNEEGCTSCFLGSIPPSDTDSVLHHFIAGAISPHAQVVKVSKQPGKAFAFIELDSPQSAAYCAQALDGQMYQGKPLACRLNLNRHKQPKQAAW